MKLTVRELLKELLTKCDLDAEVKIYTYFANKTDDSEKEQNHWKSGYNDNGEFEISVINFL